MKSTKMCSKVATIRALVTLAIMLQTAPVAAQTSRDASVVLASAQHSELVEGDLRSAIRQYQEVAAMDTADRAILAQALVYLGRSYDRLGDAAARTAYERIVTEFPDQREAFELARGRLRMLAPQDGEAATASGRDPSFTLLLDLEGGRFREVDYSSDGTKFVAAGPRTTRTEAGGRVLYVSDAGGAVPRPLLDDPGLQHFHAPRWSPDGTQIAYTAHLHPDPEDPSTEIAGIYVVSPDGSNRRQVVPDTDSGMSNAIWTPSGNITFLRREDRVLVTVDAAGNTVREVNLGSNEHESDFQFRGALAYSPDGRWLAFQAGTEGAGEAIWVIPETGGKAHRLVSVNGQYGFAWSRAGRSIYVSGLSGKGSDNIHKQGFNPRTGQAYGEPEPIVSFPGGRITRLKMLTNGGMAYSIMSRSNHVLVANASQPQETRTLARGVAGQISPDGETIYYVGEGYGRDGVFAIPTAGGEARRIMSTVPAHSDFRLSPNGLAIAYHTHMAGETNMFVLPIQGGEPRLVTHTDDGSAGTPVWSPDAARLAFAIGGDLFVVAAGGGEPERIAQVKKWETWSIRWSPEGNHLAGFAYVDGEENNPIFVVPADGGELRRLTSPDEDTYREGLEWHPDGQRLSYMAYLPDGSRLAYLDGRPTTLLVDLPLPNWDYVGTWTPDGSTYLFGSSQGDDWAVYAYDEARDRTTEYYAPGSGLGPGTWSRDGRRLSVAKSKTTAQVWLIEDFD